jgi:hypothetical protein
MELSRDQKSFRAHLYYLANAEKKKAEARKRYWENPEKHRKLSRQWRKKNPEKRREHVGPAYRARVKAKVFSHYGSVCACCGETKKLFLTLGHTKGDGASHRKSLGNSSGGIAMWLDVIKRNFPDDFRIECYNCNCGAFRNGGICPHVTMGLAKEQPGRPAEKQVPHGTAAS